MERMPTTFAKLAIELGLKLTYENEAQLHFLEDWCDKNISRDIRYQGLPKEKYKQYIALATDYLDVFLKHLPNDQTKKIPQYNKMNAIQYAAQKGYDQFITAQPSLFEEVLNTTNAQGMTPLHASATNGYVHTVHALLAKGANPQALNTESQPPIYSALFMPMLHEQELTPKKIAIFQELLAHAPTTIENKDSSGNSVFHLMATNHEFYPLLTELLTTHPAGAFCCNNHSQYPIHTAILNNQIANANLLLSIDKVSTLADAEHRTALHYAAQHGSAEMVQLCCDMTDDLNARDSANKTPLILATEIQNLEAVRVLIQKGADATLIDFASAKQFMLGHQ
jgi:ankyrin repeat protein